MKAVTGHTTPLKQFVYIDCSDALPGSYSTLDADNLRPSDCEAQNSRYDGQAAVFGWSFQEALFKQKWFVVGAGAIGCELLKNMAMMGSGCDPEKKGGLIVTDMDTIEISNLSRQFLFRRKDVGSKKSEVAASVVKQFNSQMNILSLGERVSGDTEHVFSDRFFKDLTGVANALDNVEARMFVDGLCVYYQLPLLESGTMGTKGNTQVVYPHLTESYSSSRDPPEKETPIAKFEDLFTSPADTTNLYLSDRNGFMERLKTLNLGQQIERLMTVKKSLIDEKPETATACILWARNLFQEFYCNEIAQLVYVYPPNHMTEHGVKFWSGTKRCPAVLTFDSNEENHVGFVYAASVLRAQQYGLAPILAVEESGVKIAVTEAEAARTDNEKADDYSEDTVKFLTDRLASLEVGRINALNSINFEKDDDLNHHVDFVTSASNLRAYNYKIAAADKIKTKQIAGKIIPALATTTSVIAGLTCLEFYKMVEVDGKRSSAPIERFKNSFVNLALPFFAFSEPIAAPVKKYGEKTFTLWDRLEIDGPKTLGQLIEYVKVETGLDVSMISSGVALIYAFFQSPNTKIDRLARDVVDAVETVSRKPVPEHKCSLVLEAQTQNEQEEDIEIPVIKYNIPERTD
uniref:Ubiquitin-activating enzyme E1 C-terminal domain-containing protein n=1 Tax=Ditylenchus dipsaci TaxID=166011 RepID=A0A915EBV2_9BILA